MLEISVGDVYINRCAALRRGESVVHTCQKWRIKCGEIFPCIRGDKDLRDFEDLRGLCGKILSIVEQFRISMHNKLKSDR